MEQATSARRIGFIALGLAILADFLLGGASWGINVGLWVLGLGCSYVWLSRASGRYRSRGEIVFGLATIFFALLFGVRDADGLKVANGIALALSFGTFMLAACAQLRNSSVIRLLFAPFEALGTIVSRFFELSEHVIVEAKQAHSGTGRTTGVLRGIAIASPLLIVFGSLFASADEVFRARLADLVDFNVDFETAATHFWTLLLSALLAGGFLWGWVQARPKLHQIPTAAVSKLGMTEVGIVLGSLNILFASFLAVQFRYLFGNRNVGEVTNGLTYSEYARAGFFELVWVATLALATVVLADALVIKVSRAHEVTFQWLGRALVGMVFCVIASAALRMKLYTDAFGLTEMRLYPAVFMVWLSLAFIWLLSTTLIGRPKCFAFGAMCAGLLVIGGLNALNPERLIVRTNLARSSADFHYIETLSDDAALAVRKMVDELPEAHQDRALRFVAKRESRALTTDWRELNLTRLTLAHQE